MQTVCSYNKFRIHLPAQSGNSNVLKRMRRFYTREAYLDLVNRIRSEIPNVALSTDMIAGFCGETEEEFEDTLSLMEIVKYDMAYLFAYSMREKTHAYHKLKDDVPEQVKKERLNKMIEVFKKHQLSKNQDEIHSYHLVLVEGYDKKNKSKLIGRTDTNKICITKEEFIEHDFDVNLVKGYKDKINKGDMIVVRITNCSNNTLFADPICKLNSMKDFLNFTKGNPFI